VARRGERAQSKAPGAAGARTVDNLGRVHAQLEQALGLAQELARKRHDKVGAVADLREEQRVG